MIPAKHFFKESIMFSEYLPLISFSAIAALRLALLANAALSKK